MSEKQNHNFILKAALLSVGFVTASVNAIAGNIPEIANSFPHTPLYMIELVVTIPSLTMMLAILCSRYISQKLGQKKTILLGTLLCGFGGIAPFFFQNVMLMLITRAIFGFGVGCISAMLLVLILYFFDGKVRSQMIGLQGSIGGLGSLITTFIAGQLLTLSWQVSFLTYLVSFVIFFIVLIFVPQTRSIEENKTTEIETKANWLYIGFYSLLSFISVCLATFFVIKCSSLVIDNHYGQVQDGSTLIMFISAGSLLAGAMYGNIYNKMKNKSLIIFYFLCAISFFIAGISHQLVITMIAAFILGYGYMAFVPFLQEKVGNQGDQGTRTLLVLQSLGSFIAPYFASGLAYLSQSLNQQFFMAGFFYLILMIVAVFIEKKTIHN